MTPESNKSSNIAFELLMSASQIFELGIHATRTLSNSHYYMHLNKLVIVDRGRGCRLYNLVGLPVIS